MAVEIPDGYIQLILHWNNLSTNGSNPVTVLGAAWDDAVPGADFGTLAQAAATALTGPVSDLWSITLATVRIGATGGPPYASAEFAVSADGDQTDPPAPSNVAQLIAKATFVPGRAGRGRIYLPGCPETEIDGGGNLTGTQYGLLQTAANDLQGLTATVDGLTGWVILHPEGSPLAATPSFIAGHVARTQVATQRRRLRR